MDPSKFSFAEMCSNDNGKTSGSKTIAIYWGFFVPVCLICGIVAYFTKEKALDLLTFTLEYCAVVSAVLTGTKYISGKFGGSVPTPPSLPATEATIAEAEKPTQ